MDLGLIGLGRMGANMATRLLQGGQRVVVYNRTYEKAQALAAEHGAVAARSVEELVAALEPRFRSRQDDSFGARVLAALRNQFGGPAMKKAE